MKVQGTLRIESPVANKQPVLIMDPDLMDQVKYLVRGVKTKEVQWYHTVTKKTLPDRPNHIYYELEDLIIPWQTVHGGECDTTVEDQQKTLEEVRDRFITVDFQEDVEAYKAELEKFNEFNGKLTCWCHSHVKMGVTPSGTDDSTYKKMIKNQIDSNHNPNQPVVMLIWNQRDELFTKVYDPELDIMWSNVPFTTYVRAIDKTYIDASLKTKITQQSWSWPSRPSSYQVVTKSNSYTTPDWLLSAYKLGALKISGVEYPRYSNLYNETKFLPWKERQELVKIGKDINSQQQNWNALESAATALAEQYGDKPEAYWLVRNCLKVDDSGWDTASAEIKAGIPNNLDIQEEITKLLQQLENGWWTHTHFLAQAVAITNRILDTKEAKHVNNLLSAHEAWNDWITIQQYSTEQYSVTT